MPKYDVTDYLDGTTLEVQISIKNGPTFPITGLSSISYGTSVSFVKVKGVGNKHRGTTPGTISADDGSMELFLKDYENWVELAGGEDVFALKSFDVTITHRSGPGKEVLTKKLKDCRPIGTAKSHSFDSNENLVCTLNFSVLSVV